MSEEFNPENLFDEDDVQSEDNHNQPVPAHLRTRKPKRKTKLTSESLDEWSSD